MEKITLRGALGAAKRMGRSLRRQPNSLPLRAESDSFELPVPTEDLIGLSTGGQNASVFLKTGAADVDFVIAAAGAVGLDLSRGKSKVLDWGCGSGRLARHWQSERQAVELFGCDISDVSIQWCQDNLPFGTFSICDVKPPLSYPDGHFDLVYAISVLTHLNFESHYLWMHELWRILKPNGVAVLTAHGLSILPIIWQSLVAGDTAKLPVTLIDEELFLCKQHDEGANETGSLVAQRAFSKIFYPFQIREFQPRLGLMGIQDTYVITKKAAGPLELTPSLLECEMQGSEFRNDLQLDLRRQKHLGVIASADGLVCPATIRLRVRLPGSEGHVAESESVDLPQKVAWTQLNAAYAAVTIEDIPEWAGPAILSVFVSAAQPMDGVKLALREATLF